MLDPTPDELKPADRQVRDRRRFTLLDMMVLVAATAVGLALGQVGWPRVAVPPPPLRSVPTLGGFSLSRVYQPGIRTSVAGSTRPTRTVLLSTATSYPSTAWMDPAVHRIGPFIPCLAAWSGALLLIRFRGPRPRRRRLLGQPGLVAAVAALVVLTLESILLVGAAWADGRFQAISVASRATFAANGTVLLAHHAGWAVVVAWLTLALTGRWRSEPSWVDRWGRVLGLIWIVVGPLASLFVDQTPWWGKFLVP